MTTLSAVHTWWSVMKMRNKGTEWLGTYEPFHIMLNDYRVADIVITKHARSRYLDRLGPAGDDDEGEAGAWMWQCLKQNRIKPYSHKEYSAYLIDGDSVVVCEFTELEGESNLSGHPLYIMVIVSFLGKLSTTPELRDLKTYFSWLRQSRRIKLVKKRRKRR